MLRSLFFFFTFFILSYLSFSKENNLITESIFSKKKGDYLLLQKDVSLKRGDIFLQSQKFEIIDIKPKYKFEEEKVYFSFKFPNKLFFTDEAFKILMDDGTYFYGSSLFYNNSEYGSYAKNLQIFPGDDGFASLSRDVIQKDENTYILKDCILSSCVMADDELIEQREEMEKNGMYKLNEIKEPKKPISSRDGYDKTRWSYILNPWSISSSEIEFNKKENVARIKHAIFRLGPVPIFYLPYLKFNTKSEEGQSGLLVPKFAFLGFQQQGIEIPLYISIANNIDLTITRSQYFSIPGLSSGLKSTELPVSNLDANRIRESSFGVEFRHLISENHGYQSYYTFTGLMTDRTQVINGEGLVSLNSNGSPIMGYRGYFKVKSFVAINDKTFLDINYTWVSDVNFLYVYRFFYAPYLKNSIHLRYVDDNHYHSFEVIEYKQLMMRIDSGAIPGFMPILRSHVNTDMDRFGGKFFYDFQSSYINRQYGFDHFQFRLKGGYNLTKNLENGFRVNFNFEPYVEFHNLRNSFIGIAESDAIIPNYIGVNGVDTSKSSYSSMNYITGNYAYIYNTPQYLGSATISNFSRQGFQSNLDFTYPLISNSKFGYSTLNPRFGIRLNQAFFNINSFVNDTAYLFRLSYYNFFSTFKTNGFSIYDYGTSPYVGLDFSHHFSNNLSLELGGAFQYTIFNNLRGFQSSFSGIPSIGLSSFVGRVALKIKTLNYDASYRFNLNTGQLLEFNQTLNGMLFNRIILGVGSSYVSRQASFFNREIFNLNIFAKVTLTKTIYFQIMAGFNLSKEATFLFPNGKVGPTMLSAAIFYSHSCFIAAIFTSVNFFTVGGLPPTQSFRFKFEPKISFETKTKPGGRKLPNRNFPEEEL